MKKQILKKKCKFCGNEFKLKKDIKGKLITKKIFCSRSCRDKFRWKNSPTLREKVKLYKRIWIRKNKKKVYIQSKRAGKKFIKNNRERFNELMRQNYQRNKRKHDSRTRIGLILNRGEYKKSNPLIKKCKVCGIKNKLHVHSENYPLLKKDVDKDIKDGKIYYVCIKHGRMSGKRYDDIDHKGGVK